MGDEMIHVLIAHLIADFMDFQIGVHQQAFGGLDAHSVEILQGRNLVVALELPAEAVAVHLVLLLQFRQGVAFIIMGLQPDFDVLQIGRDGPWGQDMLQGQLGEQPGQQHMAEDGIALLYAEQGEEPAGPGGGRGNPPESRALRQLSAEVSQAGAGEEQQLIFRRAVNQDPAGGAAVQKVEAALRQGGAAAGGQGGEEQGAGL